MNQLTALLKMNGKLLLRNKGFWGAIVLIPILAVLMLNVLGLGEEDSHENDDKNTYGIVKEMTQEDRRLVYLADGTRLTVKVYDSSESRLADYLLDELADKGLFEVFRYRCEEMTDAEIEKAAKEDADGDRIGVIVYLKADFEISAQEGNAEQGLTIFRTEADERQELFESSCQTVLAQMNAAAVMVQGDRTALLEVLEQTVEVLPQKQIEMLNISSKRVLNYQQLEYRSNICYTFAILGLAYSFCGMLIAHSLMKERENGVYTRVSLCNVTKIKYIGSKLVSAVFAVALETGIIGIGMSGLVKANFGMIYRDYLLMIFFLGLICTMLSICIGILAGNVMSANYAVFLVWMINSLISGLYFPTEFTGWMTYVSRLAPQKWFIDIMEILLLGEQGAYTLMLIVTAAFLAVIGSIGAVGLRLREEV